MSVFRRIALQLWGEPSDPNTVGEIDINFQACQDFVEKNSQVTYLGIILTALKEGATKCPQVRHFVFLNRIFKRKEFSISIMAPEKKSDLAFVTVEDLFNKSPMEIEQELASALKPVKTKGAKTNFRKPYSVVSLVPGFLMKFAMWLLFTAKVFGLPIFPKIKFGSMILSNVGTLGFSRIHLPLVSYFRASTMVSVGKIEPTVFPINGNAEVRPGATLCFTIDHRVMDGYHAKKFLDAFAPVFNNPEAYYFPKS